MNEGFARYKGGDDFLDLKTEAKESSFLVGWVSRPILITSGLTNYTVQVYHIISN